MDKKPKIPIPQTFIRVLAGSLCITQAPARAHLGNIIVIPKDSQQLVFHPGKIIIIDQETQSTRGERPGIALFVELLLHEVLQKT